MGKTINKYNDKIAVAGTLLLIFLLYFGNIYLFPHKHEINGVKVYHSHFYSGSAEAPTHNHSAQQFNIIHQLSSFNSEEFSFSSTLTAYIPSVEIFYQTAVSALCSSDTPYCSLRAPPVMA